METPVLHDLRSYWRTFWITAAVLGSLNAVIFAVYWSAPRVPAHKSNYGTISDVPDWLEVTAGALNFPGIIVSGLYFSATRQFPSSELTALLAAQVPAALARSYVALWVKFFLIQSSPRNGRRTQGTRSQAPA
jgi:hypothetical protein